jgi:putative membrane protein
MEEQSKAGLFFTEADKERLRAVVLDVESRTIGEVVVMVVDTSDDYPEAEIIGGIFLSSLVSLILTFLFFHASIFWFVPISLVLFFPSKLLLRSLPHLKKLFLGADRKEEAVRTRAFVAFYENGLDKTKRNTGVLFFLSLFERKVHVLADQGIYSKIGQETLDRFARIVGEGVKKGRACDALCQAIQDTGQLLSTHFPTIAGDTNELSDAVIIEQVKKWSPTE